MIFLLCNDFVSSVPISPVAPVISTDLEAPEIHQSQTKQMKKEKCTPLVLLLLKRDH
jgi:hypothetical protein